MRGDGCWNNPCCQDSFPRSQRWDPCRNRSIQRERPINPRIPFSRGYSEMCWHRWIEERFTSGPLKNPRYSATYRPIHSADQTAERSISPRGTRAAVPSLDSSDYERYMAEYRTVPVHRFRDHLLDLYLIGFSWPLAQHSSVSLINMGVALTTDPLLMIAFSHARMIDIDFYSWFNCERELPRPHIHGRDRCWWLVRRNTFLPFRFGEKSKSRTDLSRTSIETWHCFFSHFKNRRSSRHQESIVSLCQSAISIVLFLAHAVHNSDTQSAKEIVLLHSNARRRRERQRLFQLLASIWSSSLENRLATGIRHSTFLSRLDVRL